jgi:hypothetical protein
MRSGADLLLVRQVLDRYQGRLGDVVTNLLEDPTTELYLGLYKRGYWFFKCGADQQVLCLRQFQTGKADDVRLRRINHDQTQWQPVALEHTA